MSRKRLTPPVLEAFADRTAYWQLDAAPSEATLLRCTLHFPNFARAFAFMSEIALHAERLDHHPHWEQTYNRLCITLTTHDAQGLTALDVQLATIIEALIPHYEAVSATT